MQVLPTSQIHLYDGPNQNTFPDVSTAWHDFEFQTGDERSTRADFTYAITPDTTITDTGKCRVSVAKDIEAVLRKIEYWHHDSISAFEVMYRDEHGVCDGVRWNGQTASFFGLRETDEGKAMEKLLRM